jgi:hypothetical protein
MALNPERYVIRDDELLLEKVGPWAKDKLHLLARYIEVSGGHAGAFASIEILDAGHHH